MNPIDIKKKLYSEMSGAADDMELDGLRKKYGKKPPMMKAPEEMTGPPELTEEELEPLLTITIAQGNKQGEPDEDEMPPEAA